jgi:hypothetical protein
MTEKTYIDQIFGPSRALAVMKDKNPKQYLIFNNIATARAALEDVVEYLPKNNIGNRTRLANLLVSAAKGLGDVQDILLEEFIKDE